MKKDIKEDIQGPINPKINLNEPHTEPLIPKWALGYMQSQWGENFGYESQEGFLDHARALRGLDNPHGDHKHPADIMVLDMFWCGGKPEDWEWPSNMIWDKEKFPEPEKMIKALHDMNYRIVMNYHRGGYDEHREEWLAAMDSHFKMGLDIPWLDFWTEGSESEKAIWDLQKRNFGNRRPLFLARHMSRPNTENAEGGEFDEKHIYMDGTGKVKVPDEDEIEKTMPMHWTGDVVGSWLGLQQTIEGIVYGDDGAMDGWSYLHCDTPGHSGVGPEEKELAIRWIQFADFTTGTRNHGWTPRAVWSWGPEIEKMSHDSRMLRYRLLPYIYTYCRQIWDNAMPLTRPLKLAYPGQRDDIRYSFMFGEEILVAPVFKEAVQFTKGKMPVYLPEGENWVDYWTHQIYEGGQTISVDVSESNWGRIPLFVKQGSIIPMGPEIYWIDTSSNYEPLTLDIYPPVEGECNFTLYDDDGETTDYQKGQFSQTSFSCSLNEELSIILEETQGSYEGQQNEEDVLLKINLQESSPSQVMVDREELSVSDMDIAALEERRSPQGWIYDGGKRILYVRLKRNCRESKVVKIL